MKPVIDADGWSRKEKEYRVIRGVPLLFGFMVSLAVNGYEIPKKKNELYEAMIRLLAGTEVQDRGADTDVCNNTVAYAGLHSFGWLLMENPVRDFHALLDSAGPD